MMSNGEPSTTVAEWVQGPTKRAVDTQPATAKAVTVSRDPHVEGFDIGPQVSLALDQEFCNFCMTFTSRQV